MPHKDCTCNSRTVDETFNNVIHSTDCELYESKYPQKDKLDELIEWVNMEYPNFNLEDFNNKAKEIKGK